TIFSQYPLMAANNGPATGSPTPVVVSFPAPGSYPYEFDYKSGTGGTLSFGVTVTQGANTLGLLPLDSMVLTSTGGASHATGQSASFTVQVTDETGAPLAQLPVLVTVTGANPQSLYTTT